MTCCPKMTGKMDVRGFFPAMKPLLDNVASEASHILNLSETLGCSHKHDRQGEHIHPPEFSIMSTHGSLNLGRTRRDQRQYPISANRAPLLSEIETLKRELGDVQQKHQSIVQELHRSIYFPQCGGDSNSKLILQQHLSLGEDRMQPFEQKLQMSNGKVFHLNQNVIGTAERDLRTSEIKIESPKLDLKKACDKIQALHQAVETSKMKKEADLKTLRMQPAVSEVTSLQSKLRASDLKFQSLEQKLFYTEQKVVSLQDRLITTDDKALYLEEALRSSEEMVQSLNRALQESETQTSTAKHKLELLQEQNSERQKTLKNMTDSLGSTEGLYWKRVAEMELSLENYKRHMDILQDALSRAESMHKEEMKQLADKMEKQAIHQQYLQNEVLDLTKELLQEQVQARKDLVGSVKCEEHLQNPIQSRHGDMTRSDDQSYAMDNLSKRRQAVITNEHLLQHDMQKGRQTEGLEKGERPLLVYLNSLHEEFMELREHLVVLRDSVKREDQRRLDWMKVLEKIQEWESGAGKLVDSLYYFQNHQMLGNKGGLSDKTDVTSYPVKTSSTYPPPEMMTHREGIKTYSWPQNPHNGLPWGHYDSLRMS